LSFFNTSFVGKKDFGTKMEEKENTTLGKFGS
jgi:hypothetical protein